VNFTEAVFMSTLTEAQGDTIRKLRRWLEVSSEAIWRAYKEVGSWSSDKLARALWEIAERLRADAEATPHFDKKGRPTDRFETGVMVWLLAGLSFMARTPMSHAMVSTAAAAVLTVMWSTGWLLAWPFAVTHGLLSLAEWNLKGDEVPVDWAKEGAGNPDEDPVEAPGVLGAYPSQKDYRPGRKFAGTRAQQLLLGPGRGEGPVGIGLGAHPA